MFSLHKLKKKILSHTHTQCGEMKYSFQMSKLTKMNELERLLFIDSTKHL